MFRVVCLLTLVQLGILGFSINPKNNDEVLLGNSTENQVEDITERPVGPKKCLIETKKYEVFTSEKVSWIAAMFHCSGQDMDQAYITSPEEYKKLVNTLKQYEGTDDFRVWTSGIFYNEENMYVWSDFPSGWFPMNYTAWRPGRPASDNKDKCVELRKSHQYKMNEVSCWDQNYVVCQTKEKSWGKCKSH